MQRGIDAGRNADHDLEEQCGNGELQGGGNTVDDQLHGRRLVAHGNAEIAGKDRLDIGEILDPQRLIETPGLAEGIDGFLRHVRPEHDLRRITGHAQDHEGEGQHRQNGNHRAEKTNGGKT
ncbi:hypothetical protein D3C80_1202720 [compost metagenome]